MGRSPVELTRQLAGEVYDTKIVRTAEAIGLVAFMGHLTKHYAPPLMEWAKKRWENRQAERGDEEPTEEMYEQ